MVEVGPVITSKVHHGIIMLDIRNKRLFWISEIIILDIQNKFIRYPEK